MKKLIGNGRPNLFKHDLDIPDSDVTLDYVLDSMVICGTVDSVVEQIESFKEVTGDFGTLVYAAHDWVNPELSKRSMELMANEVMPKLDK
jgi:alkanesulfonate monooxygenase SsuD/methylene tetrahydromethanopterin reductase-like flavin-dependent oxidoreductase (luciferase family)